MSAQRWDRDGQRRRDRGLRVALALHPFDVRSRGTSRLVAWTARTATWQNWLAEQVEISHSRFVRLFGKKER